MKLTQYILNGYKHFCHKNKITVFVLCNSKLLVCHILGEKQKQKQSNRHCQKHAMMIRNKDYSNHHNSTIEYLIVVERLLQPLQ